MRARVQDNGGEKEGSIRQPARNLRLCKASKLFERTAISKREESMDRHAVPSGGCHLVAWPGRKWRGYAYLGPVRQKYAYPTTVASTFIPLSREAILSTPYARTCELGGLVSVASVSVHVPQSPDLPDLNSLSRDVRTLCLLSSTLISYLPGASTQSPHILCSHVPVRLTVCEPHSFLQPPGPPCTRIQTSHLFPP